MKKEDKPIKMVVIVEEELNIVDIDNIGNLDLYRLVFLDEECGNIKVAIDGGEFTININKKRSLTFYKTIFV